MDSKSLLELTTISQYSLFLGIALLLFGLMEKKDKLVITGQVIFLFWGLLSFWVLRTNTIVVPEVYGNPIPKELRILSYFKLSAWFAGLNLSSLILNLLKLQFHKLSVYIVVFGGLILFFMVFNILQLPN